MNILAIGAQPGIIEAGCFGTLARLIEQGHQVVICSITNGNLGHSDVQPVDLRIRRMTEASKAAHILGGSYCTLDIDELEVNPYDKNQQMQLTELMRNTKPDLIITHSDIGSHPDFVATHHLVNTSIVQATMPLIATKAQVLESTPILYYMETEVTSSFVPTEYVDVTNQFSKKMEALTSHTSQVEVFKEGGLNLFRHVEALAEFRGLQSGVYYAEAFAIDKKRSSLTKRVLP